MTKKLHSIKMSKKRQEKTHPIDVLVGKKIREFRVRHDKSQKALGDEIGLTFQQIQKYESGKNRVSASILFEISKVLKTPVGHFFHAADSLFSSLASAGILADSASSTEYIADDKTILDYFLQIRDAKVKEAIISLLKSLAEL